MRNTPFCVVSLYRDMKLKVDKGNLNPNPKTNLCVYLYTILYSVVDPDPFRSEIFACWDPDQLINSGSRLDPHPDFDPDRNNSFFRLKIT